VGAAIVNALLGTAADPEPAVRVMAVRALGLVPDRKVVPALAVRLSDEARVVRVSAAAALFNHGISQLEGAPGQALARAQDEWAASLRTFEDVAADHATLGWLQALRGAGEEAAKELRVAIALDPTDASPHVYLGVLAAQQGRYVEALRHFKTAKALAPTYRNLDRLIDEAAKRAVKHN
jgi:tetratricopeptide (TPR) repeat protein